MVTGEVDAEFSWKEKARRIHLLVLCPNFEVAKQINDRISKYGDLNSDGRPKLKVTAAELTGIISEIDQWNEVIPAHAWTPFFSLFGSRSGFDRIEDCFQDQTHRIHAIETGLSSDPRMNWRLSCLDRLTLISNSDSHSPWPYRIGREANVLELSHVTYREIVDTVRKKDSERFVKTIETDPAYGKYHYTGHRTCNVVLSPTESSKCQKICPVCGRRLTVGVLDRVEELADRKDGFKPEGAIPYVSLIPLQEIISISLGMRDVFTKSVWDEYNRLLKRFPSELYVLLDASRAEISEVSGEKLSDAILRVRERRVKFMPGFDGVYGRPIIMEDGDSSDGSAARRDEQGEQWWNQREPEMKEKEKQSVQRSLSDYF
jgi:uncharacterized protein (TIGR00375 family)